MDKEVSRIGSVVINSGLLMWELPKDLYDKIKDKKISITHE
jgi:hypothetical protein